jgi:hypothetical protein
MFGLGSVELIVVMLVILLPLHYLIYRAYKRNMKNKVPPKIWAAVLLSIFPSPVGGILYATGIVPAVISFCVFVGIVIVAEILLKMSFDSNKGIYIFLMMIIAGILAKVKGKGLSVPGSTKPNPLSTCPTCGKTYDPQQYKQDAAEWLCSQCHAKLPKA